VEGQMMGALGVGVSAPVSTSVPGRVQVRARRRRPGGGVRGMAGEGQLVPEDDPVLFARRAALGAASSAMRDPLAFVAGAGQFTLQAAGAVLAAPANPSAEGDFAEDLRLRFAEFSDLASTSLAELAEDGRGVEEQGLPFLGGFPGVPGGSGGAQSSSSLAAAGYAKRRAERLERVKVLDGEVARMRAAIADIKASGNAAQVPVRDASGVSLKPDAYLDAMKARLDEITAELDTLLLVSQ